MENPSISANGTIAALADVGVLVGSLSPDSVSARDTELVLQSLARLADQVTGATARFASAVAESESWRAGGSTSAAAGVSRLTGIGLGRARGAIELGDAMADVPALDDAVRSGELSPGAAAAVIPAVDDDGFADVADRLIDELKGLTPAKAQTHVETWRAVANPVDDTERRRTARDSRTLTFKPVGDGMTEINGLVPNDTARTLRQVLAHLSSQQRLDESARTRQQRTVDALGDLAAAYMRGEVTGGRNVPTLIVTMTLQDLENRGTGTDTFTGQTLSSPEIDRLCCDSTIHRHVADQTGVILNHGRGKRTATPQQFLALSDQSRFPEKGRRAQRASADAGMTNPGRVDQHRRDGAVVPSPPPRPPRRRLDPHRRPHPSDLHRTRRTGPDQHTPPTRHDGHRSLMAHSRT